MTDWLDEAKAAYDRKRGEEEHIQSSAEAVFENLWREIVSVAERATDKGMRCIPNGVPRKRVVRAPYPRATASQEAILTVSLAQDDRSIAAAFDGVELTFAIAVRPDGVACLKASGQEVSAQDAAKQIMQAFLFGGRGPYAVPASSSPGV